MWKQDAFRTNSVILLLIFVLLQLDQLLVLKYKECPCIDRVHVPESIQEPYRLSLLDFKGV